MKKVLLRRFLLTIPTLMGVVLVVALLIHMIPGDPVDTIAGPYATAIEKQQIAHGLGLDRPVLQQILGYFKNVLTLDFGNSFIYKRPVGSIIAERILPTMKLAFCAILVAMCLGIPLGILAAKNVNTWIDYLAMGISLLGVSIPNFWLGPLFILIFSLKLNWLPVSEMGGLRSYILPAITLGSALSSILARVTRTSILENYREDYVRTARAKGLDEEVILLKHVLRNSSIPIVTILGLQFGVLLTGTIITEKIFDWPGLGSLMMSGIENRDYPLVQTCVLMFSATYVAVNLLTDILYSVLDPRIQLDDQA